MKSPLDSRSYRALTLENGMKVGANQSIFMSLFEDSYSPKIPPIPLSLNIFHTNQPTKLPSRSCWPPTPMRWPPRRRSRCTWASTRTPRIYRDWRISVSRLEGLQGVFFFENGGVRISQKLGWLQGFQWFLVKNDSKLKVFQWLLVVLGVRRHLLARFVISYFRTIGWSRLNVGTRRSSFRHWT